MPFQIGRYTIVSRFFFAHRDSRIKEAMLLSLIFLLHESHREIRRVTGKISARLRALTFYCGNGAEYSLCLSHLPRDSAFKLSPWRRDSVPRCISADNTTKRIEFQNTPTPWKRKSSEKREAESSLVNPAIIITYLTRSVNIFYPVRKNFKKEGKPILPVFIIGARWKFYEGATVVWV